mmetsp:Transcript_77943/g.252817  ORF Transcript_77943/g.252817 Transcript_77943/m.252817 type:complete len:283 (+) Transcript_77943:180-1028(+)
MTPTSCAGFESGCLVRARVSVCQVLATRSVIDILLEGGGLQPKLEQAYRCPTLHGQAATKIPEYYRASTPHLDEQGGERPLCSVDARGQAIKSANLKRKSSGKLVVASLASGVNLKRKAFLSDGKLDVTVGPICDSSLEHVPGLKLRTLVENQHIDIMPSTSRDSTSDGMHMPGQYDLAVRKLTRLQSRWSQADLIGKEQLIYRLEHCVVDVLACSDWRLLSAALQQAVAFLSPPRSRLGKSSTRCVLDTSALEGLRTTARQQRRIRTLIVKLISAVSASSY